MAIEPRSKQPGRSFPFLQVNEREGKPRKRGLTEIRGPYYSVVGRRYLEDLFEVMGAYVDSLKFAGGSFALMSETAVRNIIELCHDHDVLVSTGGFLEHVRTGERCRAAVRCRMRKAGV
jgi:phosphosulfolactate synthase (CoM biosynthesis protein A)